MPDPLTPPSDDRAALIAEAARMAAAYADQARAERPLAVAPTPAAVAALDHLPTSLPQGPTPAREVLQTLDEVGAPATMRTTGGRYFGFVTGGTEPIATAASILTSTWDQNIGLPVMSPVAAHLDGLTAAWVCDLLGLDGATAAFCAGASVANLTAIITARDALLAADGWDVAADGLFGAPPLQVVVSDEAHVSVLKALRLAGIGEAQITSVAADDAGRFRADRLPPLGPRALVITQAGNVNTGHSDPFTEIVPSVHEAGGWVHVDGAFGLWAAAAPTTREQVAGVEQADSWATDAHKWLNATYDAGIVICARGDDLRRSMAADAAYLTATAGRAAMHLGLQMSQRARGIELWAILATRGRTGIASLIETSCAQAARLAARLAEGGAEVLAPVVLNQALVSFDGVTTSDTAGAATDAVIEAVQRDGTCWAGGTTWQGRRAMRLSVSDSATTDADIDLAAEAILAAWHDVVSLAHDGR